MITKIFGGTVIADAPLQNKSLYIKDGMIFDLTEKELPFDESIDATGLYVCPGFIDIHTHGAGGYDFADGSVDDIISAAKAHAVHGTTTVFPTCASMSFEQTRDFVQNVRGAMKENAPGKPNIAGSHLEGPYFSMEQKGAQNPAYIKNPQKGEYEKWIEAGEGTVRRISFAPELEGSLELCRFLLGKDVKAGFAHTDGIYEEIKPLVDEGCHIATHLYSGMNTVTRRGLGRKLGGVETAFLEENVIVELIADGIHLPPKLLELIYKIKGADRICLVTDSMRGAGMPEGASVLGPKHDGMECIIDGAVAYLPDKSAYAGSVATSDRLVRVMYKDVGIALEQVIKMMCKTPAKAMGLKNRGELKKGFVADLVLFDDNIEIKKVIIEGMELNLT